MCFYCDNAGEIPDAIYGTVLCPVCYEDGYRAKCQVCNGSRVTVYHNLSGVAGDNSYEFIPCGHCDGTGVEPPPEELFAIDDYDHAGDLPDEACVEPAYLDDTCLGA